MLQFYRAAAERYDFTIDDKRYDEAATPLTGWAREDDPCASALSKLDEERLLALTGIEPPVAPSIARDAVPAHQAPSDTTPGEWKDVERWEATGREGFTLTLDGEHVITVGCTESLELVVTAKPPQGLDVTLNGQPAIDGGTTPDASYAFFPGNVGGTLELGVDGSVTEIDLPVEIRGCL